MECRTSMVGTALLLTVLAVTSASAQTAREPFAYGPVTPDARSTVTTVLVGDEDDPALDAIRRPGWRTTRSADGATVTRSTTTRTPGGGSTTVTVTTGPGASWGMVSPSWRDDPITASPPAMPRAVRTTSSAEEPRLAEPDMGLLHDPIVTYDEPGRPVTIRRDPASGHFITKVVMNGVATRMIIDTGASGTILSPDAARSTGAFRNVTHSRLAAGIGGVTALNATRVRSLVIGGRDIGSFDALIGREGIPHSLLGQTELRRLGRIVIENDVLTITPRESFVASQR